MRTEKATKKITQSGDSLVINVTTEVKRLGLGRGDNVDIELSATPWPYLIQDREAGNRIEYADTLAEAKKIVLRYERTDKREGTYTPNFYEIVKWDGSEYVPIDD